MILRPDDKAQCKNIFFQYKFYFSTNVAMFIFEENNFANSMPMIYLDHFQVQVQYMAASDTSVRLLLAVCKQLCKDCNFYSLILSTLQTINQSLAKNLLH